MIPAMLILGMLIAVFFWAGLKQSHVHFLLAILAVALIYYGLLASNGNPANFFAPTATSQIFPNLWDHITHGAIGIDRKFAGGEYFAVGPHQYVVYFGVMPALLRGIEKLFGFNPYHVNVTNLSTLLSIGVAGLSLTFAFRRLGLLAPRVADFTFSLFTAVLLATPIALLAAWGWVYHEAIIWGVAWTIVFVAFFTCWVFESSSRRRWWHGAIMGLATGMAMHSRPIVALTAVVPFSYLVCEAAWQWIRHKRVATLKLLFPGIIIACVLAGLMMLINYQRWGSPFRFLRIEQSAALIQNPDRAERLKKAGEYNLDRIIPSFAYYVLPDRDNIKSSWPFITPDQQLASMRHVPYYDYTEGVRTPILISMSYLIVLAGFGAVRIRKLRSEERIASVVVVAAGGVVAALLLTAFTVASRYTAEFVPVAIYLALVYLVTRSRNSDTQKIRQPIWLFVLLILSIVATTLTAIQYKTVRESYHRPGTKTEFRKQFRLAPEQGAIIFVIDNQRIPETVYLKD